MKEIYADACGGGARKVDRNMESTTVDVGASYEPSEAVFNEINSNNEQLATIFENKNTKIIERLNNQSKYGQDSKEYSFIETSQAKLPTDAVFGRVEVKQLQASSNTSSTKRSFVNWTLSGLAISDDKKSSSPQSRCMAGEIKNDQPAEEDNQLTYNPPSKQSSDHHGRKTHRDLHVEVGLTQFGEDTPVDKRLSGFGLEEAEIVVVDDNSPADNNSKLYNRYIEKHNNNTIEYGEKSKINKSHKDENGHKLNKSSLLNKEYSKSSDIKHGNTATKSNKQNLFRIVDIISSSWKSVQNSDSSSSCGC